MIPRLFLAGLLGALVVLSGADHPPFGGEPVMSGKADADESGKAPRTPSVPPARNPSAAVTEEYKLARRKGTSEAFELFIARHGDDPLADNARADLKRLKR